MTKEKESGAIVEVNGFAVACSTVADEDMGVFHSTMVVEVPRRDRDGKIIPARYPAIFEGRIGDRTTFDKLGKAVDGGPVKVTVKGDLGMMADGDAVINGRTIAPGQWEAPSAKVEITGSIGYITRGEKTVTLPVETAKGSVSVLFDSRECDAPVWESVADPRVEKGHGVSVSGVLDNNLTWDGQVYMSRFSIRGRTFEDKALTLKRSEEKRRNLKLK